MKRFVNGVEVEIPTGSQTIVQAGSDRFHVRSEKGSATAAAVRVGERVEVSFRGRTFVIEKAARKRTARHAESGELHAPMPGLIVDVLVKPGDTVVSGQKLLILEAMKTQQAFTAPFDGVIENVGVEAGQQVDEGDLLVIVRA